MKHLARIVLFAVALAGAAAALAQSRAPRAVEVDRIVAVINDEVITRFELDRRVSQVVAQLRRQNTPLPPQDALERQILERMILDRIQLQQAKDTGLKVDDSQLDIALARVAENNRMSLAEFRLAIERDGIAWNKFREDIRNEMAIGRLREREVDNRVAVSEGEIDNYLANPEEGRGGAEFLLAHVLLRIPEQASPEQLAKVRARAEEALAQIRRGAEFSQVAAGYSDAPDALAGGSLGWRTVDRMPTLFADIVVRMKPGETSEILRSPAGYHIVKLVNQRGGAATQAGVEQTRARHILIKTSELVSEAEARRKLVALRERLDYGADFAELARLHSNDMSASRGGDLGWIFPGDTVPEFEKAMNLLKPGEISAPVRTPFGWHLIQVQERRIEDASRERRRLLARQALRERKADEAYQEWLRQLRDRAYVELRLEEK